MISAERYNRRMIPTKLKDRMVCTYHLFCVECGGNFATLDREESWCGPACSMAYVDRKRGQVQALLSEFFAEEPILTPEAPPLHARFDLLPKK